MSMAIDMNHPLNVLDWEDSVMFAVQDDEQRRRFTEETGEDMLGATVPLDAMDEKAEIVARFFRWWNEQWGEEMVPDRVET